MTNETANRLASAAWATIVVFFWLGISFVLHYHFGGDMWIGGIIGVWWYAEYRWFKTK